MAMAEDQVPDAELVNITPRDDAETPDLEPSASAEVAAFPAPKPVQFIPYDILLPGRSGRVFARFVLPADLTEAEAERLCGVIRTLAFTQETIDAAAREAAKVEAAERARLANQEL